VISYNQNNIYMVRVFKQ